MRDETRSNRKPRVPRAPREKPTPPGPPSLKGRGEKIPTRAGDVNEAQTADSPPPFREGGPGGAGCLRAPVPHLVTRQKVDADKVAFARQLRREMTPAERLLWEELRASRLTGLHFRRQQIVHGFVADFYCHAAGVVVEVDGGVHDTQPEYDAARDLAFAALGLVVLRFRNEVVTNRMTDVVEQIATTCAKLISEQRP